MAKGNGMKVTDKVTAQAFHDLIGEGIDAGLSRKAILESVSMKTMAAFNTTYFKCFGFIKGLQPHMMPTDKGTLTGPQKNILVHGPRAGSKSEYSPRVVLKEDTLEHIGANFADVRVLVRYTKMVNDDGETVNAIVLSTEPVTFPLED